MRIDTKLVLEDKSVEKQFNFSQTLSLYVYEYARRHNDSGSRFGHVANILGALRIRKNMISKMVECGKELTLEQATVAKLDALTRHYDDIDTDYEHTIKLINEAFGFAFPQTKTKPPISVKSQFARKNDGKKFNFLTPSQIFAKARDHDPKKYAEALDNGTEFFWRDPKSGAVLELRAHPYKNGHSGFIDPDTYCS